MKHFNARILRRSAGILLALSLMLSLCAAGAQEDPVVVSGEGYEYRLSEVQAYFDAYYEAYKEQLTSRNDVKMLASLCVANFADLIVMECKYKEFGLDQMTAEEEAQAREAILDAFARSVREYAASMAEYYGTTVDDTMDAAYAMLKLHGITEETALAQGMEQIKTVRLLDYVAPNETVTESEIRAYVKETMGLERELTQEERDTVEVGLIQQKQYAVLEKMVEAWRTEYSIVTDASLLVLPEV